MVKVTIERKGEAPDVIETNGMIATLLRESDPEKGQGLAQILVAENISEKELVLLVTGIIDTLYDAIKDPTKVQAMISVAHVQAAMNRGIDPAAIAKELMDGFVAYQEENKRTPGKEGK